MVNWLNLFKTHCVSCIPLFNTLAPYAFSKTRTSRNVRNGSGRTHHNRAVVYKQLAGFSDLNAGSIIRKRIKIIFFTTQSHLKYQMLMQCIRMRIIHGFRLSSCMAAMRPFTTQNMVHPVYYSQVHTRQNR